LVWSVKFLFPVFALFLFCKLCIAEEPLRIWTNSNGGTFEARFVEKVGNRGVKIKNAAGKEFTLPRSRISQADWKYVEKIDAEQKEKEAKQLAQLKEKEAKQLAQLKEKEAKEELFRLPKSLSGKGCVIIVSLKGDVRVFGNPVDSEFLGRDLFDFSEIPNAGNSSKGNIAKIGDSIDIGGVIITGENSEAVLLLTNGTLATLNGNSRVVLENFWQTPFKASNKRVNEMKEEPSLSRTSMKLDFGEMIVEVKKLKKDSSFLVYSLLGQAGIRGTQFRFSSKDNGTTLSVTEGLVEYLDPKQKTFNVGKENSVTTLADKSSKLVNLDQNEKIRINSVISKASKSAASYDLKKLSDASKKSSQQKKTFIAKSAKNLEMIWCPPGSYLRGEDSTSNTVILTKGFYLGKFEVTQEQYQSVMGDNPSSFQGAKLPVEEVSWDDAMAFCKKLSEKEKGRIPVGWEFTLPTEAQWEYACRAGTTTKYSWGDDVNPKLANYVDSGLKRTRVVGSYRPNPWGFYDMHGNIIEWCADWYAKYPSGSLTNPFGPASGSTRVGRGGYWGGRWTGLRSAERDATPPSGRHSTLGFRVGFQSSK
jgi:formylglycine-generating enzyme required for sulfatase activity